MVPSTREERKRNGCEEVVQREDDEFRFLQIEFEVLVGHHRHVGSFMNGSEVLKRDIS